jgi:hypothetical protein
MIMDKRSNTILVTLLVAVVAVISACGGDDSDVVQRPVVRLQVGGQVYEEAPFSYCWPDAPDDLACDYNAVLGIQPANIARVTAGDEIRFIIDGEDAGTPSHFTATLLGYDEVADLGSGPESVYEMELPDDNYRVRVDIEYDDIEGYASHVSYVFGLEFAGVVVIVPTPTPTATFTPTSTPTSTATATPTNTPTPTDTPSPTPVGPPVVEALAEGTNVRAEPDVESGRLGVMVMGETYAVIGKSSGWYQIQFPDSPSGNGWVLEQLVEFSGEMAAVPELDLASIPTLDPATVVAQETAVAMALAGPVATDTPGAMTASDTPQPVATYTLIPSGPSAAETPTPPVAIPGDLGERTITGNVRMSQAGALVGVAGVEVQYAHSSIVYPDRASQGTTFTDANGRYAFDTPIILHDTHQVQVRIASPQYEPLSIQRTGLATYNSAAVFDFVLTPASQPAATAASSAQLLTNTPGPATGMVTPSGAESAPVLRLNLGGRSYRPVGYRFCERIQSGERLCIELPVADGELDRITLPRGSDAQLVIDGMRPIEIRIEYLTDNGIATGQPETRAGDNILLFTVTPQPGSYILAVRVTWQENDATYFFRVVVVD